MIQRLEQLLKYQEVDEKLYEIEKAIKGSTERKNYAKAKTLFTAALEKLDKLETDAVKINEKIASLEEDYNALLGDVAEFANIDEHLAQGGDISFYKKNAETLLNKLKSVKSELDKLYAIINESAVAYKNLKKETIKVQDFYKESKKVYDELKSSTVGDKEQFESQLKEIASGIEEELLVQYKAKRQEKVAMPILCALSADDRCKCGTQLNISEKQKIAKGELVECENCRRLLYKGV